MNLRRSSIGHLYRGVMAAADDAIWAARELVAVTVWPALVWVFFGRPGLALALIYAAGYVGERVVAAWGQAVKLPTLAGMLLAGLLLRNVPGPWRGLLAESPADWLAALRTVATAVIILRAGMSLSLPKMMADARGILALSFLPGLCEVATVMVISRCLLDVSWTWGIMAGFMHAAVSPAVVVPAAIALQDKSMGTKAGVPTRLLSGPYVRPGGSGGGVPGRGRALVPRGVPPPGGRLVRRRVLRARLLFGVRALSVRDSTPLRTVSPL